MYPQGTRTFTHTRQKKPPPKTVHNAHFTPFRLPSPRHFPKISRMDKRSLQDSNHILECLRAGPKTTAEAVTSILSDNAMRD